MLKNEKMAILLRFHSLKLTFYLIFLRQKIARKLLPIKLLERKELLERCLF
jgi:hypothetical protein